MLPFNEIYFFDPQIFVKTATSLGNMKKNDSNFRSHSVHRYIINKPCTFVFINIQVQISEAFLLKLSNYDSTRNTCKLATMLPFALPWPNKSELRCAYYGRNKARIFNGAIDSANLKKFTLNQLHLLAKWKRKM
jgi:hypothetical protein